MNCKAPALSVWLAALCMSLLCSACGGQAHTSVSFQPDEVPVQFEVSSTGISIQGTHSIVTPIGVFSIGASYSLPPLNNGSIFVDIRNRTTGFDHIYEVYGGTSQLTAVVDGVTRITVTDEKVTIDVSAGTIEQIRFKKGSASHSKYTYVLIFVFAIVGIAVSAIFWESEEERRRRRGY